MIHCAHVIGMGRLGRHLAQRLEDIGVQVQRWNRTSGAEAQDLAHWAPIGNPEAVFLAVSDGAISTVASQIKPQLSPKTLLIHHAGSVQREALDWPQSRTGVLWAPMTFQPGTAPDWEAMPLAVDTDHEGLRNWAARLAPECFPVTETQRKHLHLGAVLLGNLTAAWMGTVENHLSRLNLDAKVLKPLVQASVDKALAGNALKTVTGPAARNDRDTLNAQSDLLKSTETESQLALLHHLLTNLILSEHGHQPLPPLQTKTGQD